MYMESRAAIMVRNFLSLDSSPPSMFLAITQY
jgi:hypothetical protein